MPLDETVMREIAQTWIQFHYLSEGSAERNGLFWAYELLDDLVKENPEEAWKVIEIIRRSDGGDVILSNLAAGPLEDLLCEHGDLFIDCIENAAKDDAPFRKLLGAVWKSRMADSIWARVQAVAWATW
jgi:hypothetical protein